MRKRIIVVVLLCLLAIFVLWARNTSFITINITSESGSPTEIVIERQGTQDTMTIRTSEQSINKRVRKGDYQVRLSQEDGSYFEVVETRSFFGTSVVDAKPEGQKQREFIGNNPKQCVNYTGPVLISWQCGGVTSSTVVHQPATSTTPTITLPVLASNVQGSVEGMFSNESMRYVLVRTRVNQTTMHNLYRVDGSSLTYVRTLSELNADKQYAVSLYKNGFLVYDQEGQEFKFYQSVQSQFEDLVIRAQVSEGLELYSVKGAGEDLALTYNQHNTPEYPELGYVSPGFVDSSVTTEERDEGSAVDHKPLDKSEFVIWSAGQSKTYTLDFAAHQVRLCQKEFICALDGKTLVVYKIDGDDIRKQYEVVGVSQIELLPEGFLLVDAHGVMRFNPSTQSGTYEYIFGGYEFCGLAVSGPNNIVLCVRALGEERVLRMDLSSSVTEKIDQQILSLRKSKDIKNLSIQESFIYIVPEIGESTKNYSTGLYEYDKSKVAEVNSRINELVTELGINKNLYTIINTVR